MRRKANALQDNKSECNDSAVILETSNGGSISNYKQIFNQKYVPKLNNVNQYFTSNSF
jgi:hypothetical protein